MEKYPTEPSEVRRGHRVRIKVDGEGLSEGAVVKVITKQHNFLGVKVEIDNGKVGRVKSFVSEVIIKKRNLEKEFQQEKTHQEGQMLEFKASFLFDLKRYEFNGEIEIHPKNPHSIAKTIAAFANSQGGKLYVGIRDDDKKILGLEHDYNILEKHKDETIELKNDSGEIYIKFKSTGEFQTALKRVMDKLFLNIYDYIDNTSVDIFNSDSKELCVIEIKSSKRPVILRNGSKIELYVRHADQSEQYEDIARFCDYWCEHMCKL